MSRFVIFKENGHPLVQIGFNNVTVLKLAELLNLSHAIKLMEEIWVVIDKIVDQHRATLDPDNPRDFTDCYLANLMVSKTMLIVDAGCICFLNILDLDWGDD